jgi:hypothetical protein
MSDADAFAAQFARRATSENRGKDQDSVIGFFDTLPNEKKPAKKQPAQKKKTSTSKRKQPTSSNSKRKRL